jgi:N-acyl homoserine lactone hydrolase
VSATLAAVEPLLIGYGMTSDQGSIGFGAVYLVTAGGRRAVFDTGPTGRRGALLRALAGRGLSPADIEIVVLSHAHYDHLQNADLFRDATVFLHPAESRAMARGKEGDPFWPRWSHAILAGLDVVPAEDGTLVLPGVRVLALPGHTEGSIGLVADTAEGTAVLTGDAVSSARALRTGRCTRADFSADEAVASLHLVARTADVLYPGHDRPFTVRSGLPAEYLMPPVELRAH